MRIIKFFFLSAILLFSIQVLQAAPVFNMPVAKIQPNGDTMHCFVSGDEYYHRLHDSNGFTIIQNPQTGWWVYADTVHTDRTHWNLVATSLVPGTANPSLAGLHPNLGVDHDTWAKMQHRLDEPHRPQPKTSGRNHGTMNNIVIFIRFSDESEISTSFSSIDAMFNDSSANSTSMYNYFKTVSYNKLYIPTYYYPTPNGNNIISFQDSLPRSYYMPYNATSNTNGYQDDSESREREFSLLERAVNYVNANYPVPSTLNLDMDNDGCIDNICFVVKGTYTGWSELLWPHKWSLYDRYVYINNKRVYTFNLQLEGSGSHYFSSSTFCHEMFHSLGAPDLYHYNTNTDVSGVGSWDLMCSNTTPPQHMSAYMKWKYGNWLDSIPQITASGTYSLHSLGDAEYSNCCYKIAAQEPNQWYVLEYRDNNEYFETALSGRGLLIFRIDDRFDGNASYDGQYYFDEVYLFRPGANNDVTNGYLAQAFFSGSTSRTSFTPYTDPHPWLTGNIIDTTIAITNISVPGETISFTYTDLRGCIDPYMLNASDISGVSAMLSWHGNGTSYTLQWQEGENGTIQEENVQGTSFQLNDLSIATTYLWRVKSHCYDGSSSEFSPWSEFTTSVCTQLSVAEASNEDTTSYFIPVNTYYNYSYTQMIFTHEEIGEEKQIERIAFNYSYNEPVTTKNNCTIYMGNTTQSQFNGTAMSDFVPISQLQKVYEGPLNCSQGWNEFILDSSFYYNGIDNLVVAVDDNSGEYNGSRYKFFCTNTGDNYRSLYYCSDGSNPDPWSSSNSGSKARKKYHADMRFIGCVPPNYYDVVVTSSDEQQGTVSGGGNFMEGETAILVATAAEDFLFDYWVVNSTDTFYLNPLELVVDQDYSVEAFFRSSIVYYTINIDVNDTTLGSAWCVFDASGDHYTESTLEAGTHVFIKAQPNGNTSRFVAWSDGSTEAAKFIVLTQDTLFTAYFERVQVGIENADREIAVALTDGGITVMGAEGIALSLHDLLGRLIYSGTPQGKIFIPLRDRGVYILKSEGLPSRKIVY